MQHFPVGAQGSLEMPAELVSAAEWQSCDKVREWKFLSLVALRLAHQITLLRAVST